MEPIVVIPPIGPTSYSRTPVEVPYLTSSASPMSVAWDLPMSFSVEREDRPAANFLPPQVRIDAGALDWSPLALTYRVEGDVTLASDGLAHHLTIATSSTRISSACARRE